MVSVDDLLWECWVLECPECNDTCLHSLPAINIELTVTNSNQIGVNWVDIDTTYLSSISNITSKLEKMRKINFAWLLMRQLWVIIFLLLFLLLFVIFACSKPKEHVISIILCIFIFIVIFSDKIDRWVVLIHDLLFVKF
jgi:hypothetical protein